MCFVFNSIRGSIQIGFPTNPGPGTARKRSKKVDSGLSIRFGTSPLIGRRDRAFFGVMAYTFARGRRPGGVLRSGLSSLRAARGHSRCSQSSSSSADYDHVVVIDHGPTTRNRGAQIGAGSPQLVQSCCMALRSSRRIMSSAPPMRARRVSSPVSMKNPMTASTGGMQIAAKWTAAVGRGVLLKDCNVLSTNCW